MNYNNEELKNMINASVKLNKDQSTIVRNINTLKKSYLIQRIGSDKTGYWQVL